LAGLYQFDDYVSRRISAGRDFDPLGRNPAALAQVIADGLSALLGDPLTFRPIGLRNDLGPQFGMLLERLRNSIEQIRSARGQRRLVTPEYNRAEERLDTFTARLRIRDREPRANLISDQRLRVAFDVTLSEIHYYDAIRLAGAGHYAVTDQLR
jgi:hypothetical protein